MGGGYPRRGQLLFFVRWGEAVPRVANARDPGENAYFFVFWPVWKGGTWSGPQPPLLTQTNDLGDAISENVLQILDTGAPNPRF